MTRQDILTVEQMAELLHITPNTIYSKRWRDKWEFPSYKSGKERVALRSEFEIWYRTKRLCG